MEAQERETLLNDLRQIVATILSENGYPVLREKIHDTNDKITLLVEKMDRLIDPEIGVFPRLQALETFKRVFVWAIGALYLAGLTGLANYVFNII